ncbi:HSP20-like chaperone [Basidiobolus meristosporus CBS 931.73]|uniref:HSP20-like chaperone n=1 Tax=Basidiobolus meristosporus CBS 931.73 TaxID=1314790 RepID=A0A1Y1XZR1_9FUNG|nr:HSP20-like chaperone [Basidiobolus meristosporus CBS 931.73]|eukprot:ORX90956.1 HSP20-like chaperone [Basidiobolus meristosporus CBS 931.73]
MTKYHPELLWAQRTDEVYLTINVPDLKDETIKLEENLLNFEAKGPDGREYAFSLEFYEPINPETSKRSVNARSISMVLDKKEHDKEFWPRLQKSSQKIPFLKTDFSKWVDEDEEEEAPGNFDLPQNMDFSQFASAMGGGGMMPPMGEEEDSDEEAEQ